MTIYGDVVSGNCLKVQYVADLLHIPYRWQHVDVVGGGARASDFKALNPAGQVPAIVFPDGRVLSQSNAIMRYLAQDSPLIPEDPWLYAKMDEWLFWEQYSHETAIAVLRFRMKFQNQKIGERDPLLVKKGEKALGLMEVHLVKQGWFVGDVLSLADVALYAYTQFAPEAGFELDAYPAIGAWLERVSGRII
ncbi:MAG: glutathione S-transferase [Kordiimonadales bacterium]|nr:MAG: glutathione S-transferase [Kordiimonadales bacterium]